MSNSPCLEDRRGIAPTVAINPLHGAFLRANSSVYESLVKRAQARDLSAEPEAVLEDVAFAAAFAGKFHSGRFADGAIENLAFEIGLTLEHMAFKELDLPAAPIGGKKSRRRILHVA